MKLRTYPATCLTTICRRVEFPSREILEHGRKARDFCGRCNGFALAANQIGLQEAWFVFGKHPVTARAPWLLANPEIIETEGTWEFDESCLSLPDIGHPIVRPDKVTVKFQNEFGDWREFTAEKLLGRVLQHEIDHLLGELILRRMPAKAREVAIAKLTGQPVYEPPPDTSTATTQRGWNAPVAVVDPSAPAGQSAEP